VKIYNSDDLRRVVEVMDLASKFIDSLPVGVRLPEFKLVVDNETGDYTVATIEFEDDFAVATIVMDDNI